MVFYFWAFLIGAVSGLRALTGLAAVSWATHLGWLHLEGTKLAFLGNIVTISIVTILALVELVTDQLPKTPSRTVPMQFGARVVTGALCGAALGAADQKLIAGVTLAILGSVAGTLGGAKARALLANAFGVDTPAALLEDLIAISLAFVVVSR
ncbi:MAG TPA: DUF4126 family protein [Terriglobales bacterium]|jgi:uncharacterized membrane protein